MTTARGGRGCSERGGRLSEQHSREWGLIAAAGCARPHRGPAGGQGSLASDVRALPLAHSGHLQQLTEVTAASSSFCLPSPRVFPAALRWKLHANHERKSELCWEFVFVQRTMVRERVLCPAVFRLHGHSSPQRASLPRAACVCACMCECIMYMCTHVCVHAYVWVYWICVSVYMCMCRSMYLCVCTWICACTCVYTHASLQCVCMHGCEHTCVMCMCIYMCI